MNVVISKVRKWERAAYLASIGVLTFFILNARESNTGAHTVLDLNNRGSAQIIHKTTPGEVRNASEFVTPPPMPGSDGGDGRRPSDTIVIPRKLAQELRFFLFEPGTFILSGERLQMAGLNEDQILKTEALYASTMDRLRIAEEKSAKIQEVSNGAVVILPALDRTMSVEFDDQLVGIVGDNAAQIIGPNLKRAEALNSFGQAERRFRIVKSDAAANGLNSARITFETVAADGSIQSSTVSENFFSQRYPSIWGQVNSTANAGTTGQANN